jgi:hypothetical protein
MNNRPKTIFNPRCDLHDSPMRRLMLEEAESENTQSFHQCERSGCDRIFRDSFGYSDFADGQFDTSRASIRVCPVCRAALYLAEVDHPNKIEIWECPGITCDYNEEDPSPSSR